MWGKNSTDYRHDQYTDRKWQGLKEHLYSYYDYSLFRTKDDIAASTTEEKLSQNKDEEALEAVVDDVVDDEEERTSAPCPWLRFAAPSKRSLPKNSLKGM